MGSDQPNGAPRRDRHLLVAVDGSPAAERAVFYVADFLGGAEGFRATLLHVLPVPEEDFFDTAAGRERWLAERRREAEAFMRRYRLILTHAGFPEEKVREELLDARQGLLSDLILERQGELGACTIVVGRRGMRREEEFLFGSVSNRLIHAARGCSVWVIE